MSHNPLKMKAMNSHGRFKLTFADPASTVFSPGMPIKAYLGWFSFFHPCTGSTICHPTMVGPGVCISVFFFNFSPMKCDLGGGFKHFLFSPLFGEMIQFHEHIFQMGWFNHQLVMWFLLIGGVFEPQQRLDSPGKRKMTSRDFSTWRPYIFLGKL